MSKINHDDVWGGIVKLYDYGVNVVRHEGCTNCYVKFSRVVPDMSFGTVSNNRNLTQLLVMRMCNTQI